MPLLPAKGGTFVSTVALRAGRELPFSQISRLRLAKAMLLEAVSQVGMGSPSEDKESATFHSCCGTVCNRRGPQASHPIV